MPQKDKYQRRRPEKIVFYKNLVEHLDSFLANPEEERKLLPKHVEKNNVLTLSLKYLPTVLSE